MNLDSIFHSLADATRRDILRRVSQKELSVGELARPYNMSFAAIAKHIHVLEMAKLVKKRREGKRQMITIVPKTLEATVDHLEKYEEMWRARFDALDSLLQK